MNLLKYDKKRVELLTTVEIDGLRLLGPIFEFFFPSGKTVSDPALTNEEKANGSYRSWRLGVRNDKGERRKVQAGSKEWVPQETARKLVLAGQATLLEGGNFSVYEEKDGFHRIDRWEPIRPFDVPPPVKPEFNEWEIVETLVEVLLGTGVVLPIGFRFRSRSTQWFAGRKLKHCTWAGEDPKRDAAGYIRPPVRILRPNPSASAVAMRQDTMAQINAKMHAKLYPDQPLPPLLEQAAGLPAVDREDQPSDYQIALHRRALAAQQAERNLKVWVDKPSTDAPIPMGVRMYGDGKGSGWMNVRDDQAIGAAK